MLQSEISNPEFSRLFEPGSIGGLWLKNRLIKAPMVTKFADSGGCVTGRMIGHYREVARGGVGLVIVENSHVDNRASKSGMCQLSSSGEEHKPGLKWLASTIKSNGAKACLQLGHAGRQKFMPPIKAPSRIPWNEEVPVPEELTFEEIGDIVDAFGNAALRARQVGFDMVEIVACHGYLFTNFLSPLANRRTDWYGGSLENRMRFLLEVVGNIFARVGRDYPLSVRLSGTDYVPGGITIEETKKVVEALEKAGVSAIHASGAENLTIHLSHAPMYGPLATNVWAAEEFKGVVGIPIIASGSITTPQLAETILEQGKADFISLGRPLIADPYFPLKAEEGRPEDIRPCIRCLEGCVVRGVVTGSIECTVNASVGREDELRISPVIVSKKVAVVGGGPAGMEAAMVAARRGHKVTLFEKRELGGMLIEASIPEFKSDVRGLLNYLSAQIEKAGVEVVAQEATSQMIRDGGFDVVIVAAGATPLVPDVPGVDKSLVVDALDVLRGAEVGRDVIVVSDGIIGCDITLFLAEQGKKVIVVTGADDFARSMNRTEQLAYSERLSRRDVEIRTGVYLSEVTDEGIIVHDRSGNRSAIRGDNVVLAAGLVPRGKLFGELSRARDLRVCAIGDCVEPRAIFDAIHEGYWTAFNLI